MSLFVVISGVWPLCGPRHVTGTNNYKAMNDSMPKNRYNIVCLRAIIMNVLWRAQMPIEQENIENKQQETTKHVRDWPWGDERERERETEKKERQGDKYEHRNTETP